MVFQTWKSGIMEKKKEKSKAILLLAYIIADVSCLTNCPFYMRTLSLKDKFIAAFNCFYLNIEIFRGDIAYFEKFLQMYKRICLQTGENVVLLTVFVNIRDGKFEGEENEPFVEFKNLISR